MATARVTSKIIKDIDLTNGGAIEKLRQRIAGTKSSTVNVGFPANGRTHQPEQGEGEKPREPEQGEGEKPREPIPMAALAAVHEFGTEDIPERSFLRAGIRRNKGEYIRLNRQTLLQVLRGRLTIVQALGLLGEQAKADVQMEITNGDFAPLKPATIRRKGSSEPLIDSGQLRQNVEWELGDD